MRFPFWRRRREEELDEEINGHLRLAAQDRLERGESPGEAGVSAKRELGNVGMVKEITRHTWGLMWLERLVQDLRYGIRMLQRNPGFTAVAVLSLALGIGANTAIFSVVNVLLFKPLPYPEPERLMAVEHSIRDDIGDAGYWTYPAFDHLRTESKSFQQIAAYSELNDTLTISGEPGKEWGEIVSADYFPTLGINASIGRTFLPDEDVVPNAHPVILLSHSLWRSRAGGDPAVIGKTVYLNQKPFTVVGVLPAGFRGQSGTKDFWIPTMMAEAIKWPQILSTVNANWLQVLARLKSDVSIEQAKAELTVTEPKLAPYWPDFRRQGSKYKSSGKQIFESKLVPLKDTKINPKVARAFLILLGAVICVLLIACANTANLLLARAIARQREFAVRLALGAGRNRIIRQMLTESLLLSISGGIVGLFVAFLGVKWLTTAKPWNSTANWTPYAVTFEYFAVKLDWRVLSFTLIVALTTGIIFGLVPAWQSSRLQLTDALKESSGSSASGFRCFRRLSVRGLLIIVEIALSVVLLAGAGLMIKSVSRLSSVKLGYVPDNVITMSIGSNGATEDFYGSLIEQVSSLQGIQKASLANGTPLGNGLSGFSTLDATIEDQSPVGIRNTIVRINVVTPDYFSTFRIATVKGRAFTDQDRASTKRVAVISRTMAELSWPGKDPIGRRLKTPFLFEPNNRDPWLEVVGVVDDVKYVSVEEEYQSVCYVPFLQATSYGADELSFRAGTDTVSAIAAIRNEVKKLSKDSPIYGITTMEERTSQATSRYRYSAILMTLFAGIALLLASVGIYGVINYSVSARTRELGIRVALGALPSGIVKLVIADAAALIIAGLVIGLMSAVAATRVLLSQLYQVDAIDPLTFAIVTMLLILVGLVACYLPARRATKVDPMIALRYE